MKKFITIFIICFLLSTNFSFATSIINFNEEINRIIALRDNLDIVLNRYENFLNSNPNYDGSEVPSEIEYLDRQVSVYQSHIIADLLELRELYNSSSDLEYKAKIGNLYSILIDYLETFNYLRVFSLEEDKSNVLYLANKYKSYGNQKLNLFIENYINSK